MTAPLGGAGSTRPRIVLVAAVADNGVIGDHGRIPWHLPEDFAHFKATTMGGVMIMGRATFESIGRPLPGRTTIVITRDPTWAAPGVLVAHSSDEALSLAAALTAESAGADSMPTPIFVVGGAQVYAEFLPIADEQLLSRISLQPEGDVRYPDFTDEWVLGSTEARAGFTIERWHRSA
ncbi:MAG: dihydrofolate reductase [Nocardioides sp.]